MSLLLLFVFVLVVVFALVMLLTRPTRTEKLVQSRLQVAARGATADGFESIDILKRENYSELPWLNSVLLQLKPAYRLRRLIADADQNWTVGRLVSGSLLGGLLVLWFGHTWIKNPIVVPVLALAVTAAPYAFLFWRKGVRRRKFSSLLPDAMDLVSRALRAGHSITASLELVAQEISDPVGTEFRRLFEEQNLGLPLRDALLNLADRVPIPDVQFLVAALLIQRETGGNLVEVLDKTTTLLRERIRLQRQLRVYTAQGRLTGWILCILPFVAFLGLSLVNPQYVNTLLTDSLGQTLLIVGGCLMTLGILVIRKIINIKV